MLLALRLEGQTLRAPQWRIAIIVKNAIKA